MINIREKGIALWCDSGGKVQEIIHDDLGISPYLIIGNTLLSIISSESLQKTLSFFVELRNQQASFGWEMNISLKDNIIPLHFAGSYTKDAMLIVAAQSQKATDKLYEQLTKINNEQTNLLRQVQKENIQLKQLNIDNHLYNEITRMNNELVNTQRELAQKNAVLLKQKELLEKQTHELEQYRQILAREKEFIYDTFGKMVDPRVRDHLLNGNITLGGELKQATILFVDIRGFTTISEKMRPDDIVDWLNQYFEKMSQCIAEEQGLVNKYIGDAILAVFGVPIDSDNHADAAVQAAFKMQTATKTLNKTLKAKNWPIVKTGIGIHTGTVLAGNIGSSHRMEFTVIGDAVNISSRIEKLSKTYKHNIIISEATVNQLSNPKIATYLDTTEVKGKQKFLKLYHI